MICPCCKLTGPHKAMGTGCIPALRARIAELEAEVEAAYMRGCEVSEKSWRRDGAEAALRWAAEELRRAGFYYVPYYYDQELVDRGLKALLEEK